MSSPDVLIIGGGVIGCCLARELARAGGRVVVLERGRAGAAASSAAAGLLLPNIAGENRSGSLSAADKALAELCRQSASRYESWVAELRAETAGDVGFRRPGLLDVWTEGERPVPPSDGRVEVLSAGEVRRLEPALAPAVAGANFYPEIALVDPVLLSRAVARAAQLAGAEVRESEPVYRLESEGKRITCARGTADYRPGVVVLTAGAWSGQLVESLGVALPTRPVKGQMLMADCQVSPVRTPVDAAYSSRLAEAAEVSALFVPRPDGRLTLGVTVEEAGFDDRVTLDGLRGILERTAALVPAVGRLPLARAWAGLRPALPDGLPCMGPVPPFENLWVSTGHFRKGILLAPVCGEMMSRSIMAGQVDRPLEAFGVERFRLASRGR